MISLYLRKVRNGHQYIIMDDLCVKLAEGKIQGDYSWPLLLRIIANQAEIDHFASFSKKEGDHFPGLTKKVSNGKK